MRVRNSNGIFIKYLTSMYTLCSALAEGHGKIDILSLILITSHVLVQIGFSWREKKMLSRIMYGTKGQCQQKNDLVDLPQLRVVVKN